MSDPNPDLATRGSLAGRVALITGGGQGLGAAIADALARDGASVTVLDTNIDAASAVALAITERHGVVAHAVRCDVRDRVAVDAEVSRCLEQGGSLDILVNNAGVSHVGDRTESVSDEAWHDSFAVMVHGTFYLTRAVGRAMLAAGRGAIVNVSSIRGVLPRAERLPYATAKAAILMMTRCTAGEWARDGVRVNAVLPGFQATPMWDQDVADGLVDATAFLAAVPAGRLGQPSEVADLVAFLASDRAAYITGACITIDGGVTSSLP